MARRQKSEEERRADEEAAAADDRRNRLVFWCIVLGFAAFVLFWGAIWVYELFLNPDNWPRQAE